jgi:hypothetical protein
MSTGSIRNLIIARAASIDPFARALYRDPLDGAAPLFARPADRWQKAARAAQASPALDIDDDANAPAIGSRS